MDEKKLCSALEAVLFAAGDSVDKERLASVFGVTEEELLRASERLEAEYEREGRGIRLVRMEDKLQLVSAPEWSDEIIHALEKRRSARLSPAALEVLAIVAYFQPVTRSYIEKLRGVDSSYTVAFLAERGLIEAKGKLEAPGRPTLFGTGEGFLRVMGIRSLDELPPLPEVESDEGVQKLRAAIAEAEESDALGQMEIREES